MTVVRVHDDSTPVRAAGAARYRIDNGILVAEVWEFGATLLALQLPDGTGGSVDVVLRHDDLDRYTDPRARAGYLGATIGRFANRIARARFTCDGHTYELTRNEGSNHLHGGSSGFDQRCWTATVGDDEVLFTLVSPDGDQGYPGTLTASVRYRVRGASLELEYQATADAPTVVNLTNHAYWNLAGGGRVDEHEITLRATHVLPVDEEMLPTGAIEPVVGTRFDLRRPTRLGEVIAAGGTDHCFLVGGRPGFRDVAVLFHPPSGRSMVVATDQPGIQLYTANRFHPPHVAVCLETQRPPDAPNQHHLGPSVLRPGETYSHRTTHTFTGPGVPPARDASR